MASSGKSAVLTVRILVDAAKAAAGMDQASQKVSKFETGISKLTGPALAVGGAIIGFGKVAVDSASRLQQAYGALDSVFGKNSKEVKSWAETASTAVGLSKAEYSEFASILGAQLKNMTGSAETAMSGTKDLISLGADLAATYGGTTAEAVEALSAALRGESDPIERYGISVSAANIQTELAAKKQDKLTGAAANAAKAQAILDIVTRQAGGAVGQFQRETDTAAGSAQIAAAKWEDSKAALGEVLLPVVAKATAMIGDLAAKFGQHKEVFQKLAAVALALSGAILTLVGAMKAYRAVQQAVQTAKTITAFKKLGESLTRVKEGYADARVAASTFSGKAGSLGGALRSANDALKTNAKATAEWVKSNAKRVAGLARERAATIRAAAAERIKTAVTKIGTAIQRAYNAVAGANPIIKIITIILAVVAALVVLYKKNKAFRDFVNKMWAGIKKAAEAAWKFIQPLVGTVIKAITGYVKAFMGVATGVWNTILSVVKKVWPVIQGIIKVVFTIIKTYVTVYVAVVKAAFTVIRTVVTVVWNVIRAVVAGVISAIRAYILAYKAVVLAVWSVIRTAAVAAWNLIRNAIASVISAVRSIVSGLVAFAVSAWNRILSVARSVFSAIASVVSSVVSRVVGLVRSMAATVAAVWAGIRATASSAWNGVVGIVSGVIGRIRSIVSGAASIMAGIWNGVRDAAGRAWSTITSTVQRAIDAVMTPIRRMKDAIESAFGAIGRLVDKVRSVKIPSWLNPANWLKSPAPPTPAPTPAPTRFLARGGVLPLAGRLGIGARAATSGGSSGGGVVINVTGVIDPVGTAQTIKRILTADSRRRGGVVIHQRSGAPT